MQVKVLKKFENIFKEVEQMNNRAIRTAMLQAGIRQRQLAEIMGCSEASVSLMLRYELSRAEQRKIVSLIKEHEARNNETHPNDSSSI